MFGRLGYCQQRFILDSTYSATYMGCSRIQLTHDVGTAFGKAGNHGAVIGEGDGADYHIQGNILLRL